MLEYFVINSLIIWGVHSATRPGMILDTTKLYYLTFQRWPMLTEKSHKVLFDCAPCMSSFYGTIFFLSIFGSFEIGIWALPVWVVSLAGFNHLIIKFYK